MNKTLLTTSVIALVHAMSAMPALAADDTINDQLTNAQFIAFCNEAGVGTETVGEFTLPDGSTISGNVDCDEEALIASAAADPNALVSAGDDTVEQDGDNNDDGDSGDTGESGDTGDSGDSSDSGDASDSGESAGD